MSVATSGMATSGERTWSGRIRNAILIAGPTASGKSALALELALRSDGVIVNADSMQVYEVLDRLTARPKPTELAQVQHLLYGHVHPSASYSTGAWLRDVSRLIEESAFEVRPAIFVGGTGLYFRALAEGLSEMPEIPSAVRERWRLMLQEEGAERLHGILRGRDAAAAAVLNPGDSQRIVRALEVHDASGMSILEWQARRSTPLVDPDTTRFFVVDPARSELVRRVDMRFDAMMKQGAMNEVKELCALRLDPALPAMKAIGVRELAAAMAGEVSIEEAIERAKIASRQYAKRQATWFRHQLDARWKRVDGKTPL